ncbi:MAG: ferritin-like domain-containing protein, partial [Verrucomicrobiota bacterium]
LSAPDAVTQTLIDNCRRPNAPDCMPLCLHVSKMQVGSSIAHCELHPDRDGFVQVHVGTTTYCPGGRRPEGLILASSEEDRGGSSVGHWFARLAEMEEASVPAFTRLGAELTAHGAPPALITAAAGAVRDEIRHTRVATALARRYGARPRFGRVSFGGARSLEEVAVENAAEGCVRETHGAVVALWQSRNAADPVVRRALARIAEDEIRHAAIAWGVRRWADDALTTAARRRVRAAERHTVAMLAVEAMDDPSPSVRDTAGLPDTTTSSLLLHRLGETFWRC